MLLIDLRACLKIDFNDVVNEYEAANNETLADFDTINASIYVNCVSTEHRYQAHINEINESQIYKLA